MTTSDDQHLDADTRDLADRLGLTPRRKRPEDDPRTPTISNPSAAVKARMKTKGWI